MDAEQSLKRVFESVALPPLMSSLLSSPSIRTQIEPPFPVVERLCVKEERVEASPVMVRVRPAPSVAETTLPPPDVSDTLEKVHPSISVSAVEEM